RGPNQKTWSTNQTNRCRLWAGFTRQASTARSPMGCPAPAIRDQGENNPSDDYAERRRGFQDAGRVITQGGKPKGLANGNQTGRRDLRDGVLRIGMTHPASWKGPKLG